MAAESTIRAEIQTKVSFAYREWRIGITHYPYSRKQEWQNQGEDVSYWTMWQADSLLDAQAIERYFIAKGMKGGTGGNMTDGLDTHVYIF